MAVKVEIPVRIRVDHRSLDERADELERALSAAAARALARSREVVIDPRGGFLDAVLDDPTFLWSGSALAQVPGDLRRRVETRLAALLCDTAARRRSGGVASRPGRAI